MNRFLCCLLALILPTYWAFAGEIGYVEDFALARDRAESLKKLIPGTEDYYYYHCLHYLHSEQYEKVEAASKPWLERFGQTPRLTEIQTRYALLTYDKNPEKSLGYLRTKLGLYFNHQKETSDGPPNLPTALDPKRIARATLLADSLNRWQNLDNFEDRAFDWLPDGTVKFYKDGYTDHRGRFDNSSVSTPERSPVVRFSVLVLSDEHGALIRETNPPVQ